MIDKNPSPRREVNKFKEFGRIVMEHHFGSRPTRMEHKTEGLSNFVFSAQQSKQKYIIRISPDPAALNAFIKEQWTQKAAHAAGVVTAEILEVGNSIVPYPYMITRYIPGEPAGHHPKRLSIIRELGEIAARINSIRTNGFGGTYDWSHNLLSLNASWKDYLENEYRYKDKVEILKRHNVMDASQAKRAMQIFREASKLAPRPALCHGDLRLKNVIVDRNGKISGILDWQTATSNIAPQWELSLALHDLGIDEKQVFLEGYEIGHQDLLQAMPLIKAFNVLNYSTEVERAFNQKDSVGLERCRTRLSGAFDMFSL